MKLNTASSRPPVGQGIYVDGETGAARPVSVACTDDGTLIAETPAEWTPWPYADLRRLPGTAGQLLSLTSASAPMARLYIRDPILAEGITRRAPRLDKLQPRVPRRKIAAWGLGAVASVALIITVLVPTMANQLARFLPPAGEQALGDATFGQIRNALSQNQNLPVAICDDPRGMAALQKIADHFAPHQDLPYPVRLNILDHDMVNAFALPGGYVVFFDGLIQDAETPDELAAVLAHELGHVAARDPSRHALRTAGSIGVLGLMFGDFAGGTVVLFLANALIDAQYSQAAEAAADAYAHDLMAQSGLDPATLGTFFERLRDKHGDQDGLAAHFAAHPSLAARIEAAAAARHGAGHAAPRPILADTEWMALKSACGPRPAAQALPPKPQQDRQRRNKNRNESQP
jgi:predicted Zn-dependent protease